MVLTVTNSLKNAPATFVPHEGNTVNWYCCGPTVYDDSHLGHARSYVVFDTIRRILVDFFGYHVNFVLNITDIDDKIINKANALETGVDVIARYYEAKFFQALNKLNCLPPSSILRVTDYIPEIVSFIEQIISNGYAYESNGSVYFDLTKFKSSEKHKFPKLQVHSDLNSLEPNDASKEKRCPLDFVLWKAAKPHEPFWDSPWGKGRPGWHIECSALSNLKLGNPIDIHSGGIDLIFPHHTNEIAQSEAFHDAPNVFLNFWHCGHLNIEGSKMSKSLKNFIAIDKILEERPFQVVRILFLLNRWDKPMNFINAESSWNEANSYHKIVTIGCVCNGKSGP
ncbi:cysteine--tRNA ligase, cytoplasmic-like [Dermatophagoides farinae]|uniref:cysteine--tRNA ligase, cytoplasmic-like n=1 Tax=Dermatophagoides farinae TaxID=6954 RepID=UPI003F5D758D